MAALIMSNEEMDGIIKVVKSFEQLGLLIKGVGKQLKMKQEEQKGKFLRNLFRCIRCQLSEVWQQLTFTLINAVNVFIVYELDNRLRNLIAGLTLKDCFFGSVKLTKNTDSDKCFY